MTKGADFKRHVRARMHRTGESYTAARARLHARRRAAAVLHVTNGDAFAGILVHAGVTDEPLPWRDALHEGPVPAAEGPELRKARAAFLAAGAGDDAAAIERMLRERDERLAGHEGAYVLWFEADLYDQLQLVQIVTQLGRAAVAPGRVEVVCVGEYPGVAFRGLTDVAAAELETLYARAATTLTAGGEGLAEAAWEALTAPAPDGLAAVAATTSPELRFVGEAFDRLAREYPSTRDGLSLTERRLLAPLVDADATAGELFVQGAAREVRPFLGDDFAYAILARLAGGAEPLAVADGPVTGRTRLQLTAAGRAVLAGEADHVALNGIDRWVGGVRLEGRTPWRFDEARERVVAV